MSIHLNGGVNPTQIIYNGTDISEVYYKKNIIAPEIKVWPDTPQPKPENPTIVDNHTTYSYIFISQDNYGSTEYGPGHVPGYDMLPNLPLSFSGHPSPEPSYPARVGYIRVKKYNKITGEEADLHTGDVLNENELIKAYADMPMPTASGEGAEYFNAWLGIKNGPTVQLVSNGVNLGWQLLEPSLELNGLTGTASIWWKATDGPEPIWKQ